MTTYKTVFQLAQDKGYEISDLLLYSNHSQGDFLELTLVQKWLRDEHKIATEASSFPIYNGKYGYRYFKKGNVSGGYETKNKAETYEQALLEGCEAALKLINNG